MITEQEQNKNGTITEQEQNKNGTSQRPVKTGKNCKKKLRPVTPMLRLVINMISRVAIFSYSIGN